jgi:hypothetical protein
MPPPLEGALAFVEIREMASVQHLSLEGAMEALVLALGHRMIGPPMSDPHAEPHQPHRKRGVGAAARIAPGRPIFHQHRIGQPVAPKHRHQALARGPIPLVATPRSDRMACGRTKELPYSCGSVCQFEGTAPAGPGTG